MEKKILTKRLKRIEIEKELKSHIKDELLPNALNDIDLHVNNSNFKIEAFTKGDPTIKNMILNKYFRSEENFNNFVSWFEAIIDRPMTDEEKQRARNNSITKF
jgi:hypothetical protein